MMGRDRQYSDDQIRALYAQYQRGRTLRQLAATNHISVDTLRLRFAALGLPRRDKGNWAGSHKPERDRQIIAVYLRGKDSPHKTTYTDIGREFGISRQRVKAILKRAGYPKNTPKVGDL